MNNDNMKILIICGSIAKKSHTRALLKYCEALLIDRDVEVEFWDLLTRPLSFVIPEFHKDPTQTPNENVKALNGAVVAADGIILGSPLYHGSYSGVLKNALDNLPYDALKNKPVGLVSNGGMRNGAHPCEHLRLVVRALYGYVLQSQIGTGEKDYNEIADGFELEEQEIKDRAVRLVDELVAFASVLKERPINK
ncbi:NAD(P)H-dependent oxidoreductase [Candidatus Uhrbacteria bacterium]|nr:NAD(P)H-dependent oxidoreductase [Candidatus Uhrbacteria bacterium]